MIQEKAVDLGRLIGQSEEYKALTHAREAIEGEKELNGKLEQLQKIAEGLEQKVAQGQEPEQSEADEYDRFLGEIQGDAAYQRMVSAQSNFDKLMLRVQDQILEGMRKGAESPIITLS